MSDLTKRGIYLFQFNVTPTVYNAYGKCDHFQLQPKNSGLFPHLTQL